MGYYGLAHGKRILRAIYSLVLIVSVIAAAIIGVGVSERNSEATMTASLELAGEQTGSVVEQGIGEQTSGKQTSGGQIAGEQTGSKQTSGGQIAVEQTGSKQTSGGQIVDEQTSSKHSSGEVEQSTVEMPIEVSARSAVLMDADSGRILAAKNENEQLYPASVTKIMSVILVAEAIEKGQIDFDTEVTASPNASSKGGSQIWLREGETMTVDELLRATMIGSANDGCTALAEKVAGSEGAFVTMMNERAQELGMTGTNFENCTGLDDTELNHKSTARDIAIMSRELLKHDWITKYSTVWMDSLRGGETELTNTNRLVRTYEGTTGLKTGTTSKAGSCLAASACRNGTHLIAVVLASPTSKNRFDDAKNLLNWGFANYVTVTIEVPKDLVVPVNVKKSLVTSIKPNIPKAQKFLVPIGDRNKIDTKVTLAVDVTAPVEKGQVLGKAELFAGNNLVGTVNLTAPENVQKITYYEALKLLLKSLN